MRPLNAFKKALGLNRGIGMIQLRRWFLIQCPQFAWITVCLRAR
jgi:hypothetical protein